MSISTLDCIRQALVWAPVELCDLVCEYILPRIVGKTTSMNGGAWYLPDGTLSIIHRKRIMMREDSSQHTLIRTDSSIENHELESLPLQFGNNIISAHPVSSTVTWLNPVDLTPTKKSVCFAVDYHGKSSWFNPCLEHDGIHIEEYVYDWQTLRRSRASPDPCHGSIYINQPGLLVFDAENGEYHVMCEEPNGTMIRYGVNVAVMLNYRNNVMYYHHAGDLTFISTGEDLLILRRDKIILNYPLKIGYCDFRWHGNELITYQTGTVMDIGAGLTTN